MKTLLVLSLATAFAIPALAQEFRASAPRRAQEHSVFTSPPVEGSLQHAARLGNPLQVLNPVAPREYGKGERFVYADESGTFVDPQKRRLRAAGLRLFAFTW